MLVSKQRGKQQGLSLGAWFCVCFVRVEVYKCTSKSHQKSRQTKYTPKPKPKPYELLGDAGSLIVLHSFWTKRPLVQSFQ